MSRTYKAAAKQVAEKVAETGYTGTDSGEIFNQIEDADGWLNPDERAFLQEFPNEDSNMLKEYLADQIVKVREGIA
jgi:hypothetical protein